MTTRLLQLRTSDIGGARIGKLARIGGAGGVLASAAWPAVIVANAILLVQVDRIALMPASFGELDVRSLGFLGASVLGNAIMLAGALLAMGPLPRRIALVFSGALAVYALLAAALLLCSRPALPNILLTNGLMSVVSGVAVVHLRHSWRTRKIGVVAAAYGRELVNCFGPSAQMVAEPSSDPRGYDLLLVDGASLAKPGWPQFVSAAAVSGCEVCLLSRYAEERAGRILLDHYAREILDGIPDRGLVYPAIKRAVDTGLVLALSGPALIALAIAVPAILVSSGRPVLFVQDRVGLGGRVFRLYKLRTMRTGEPQGPQIATATNDDRITPLGKVLRRYHIDELPQLWNVLKGQMSLIGPRPEQPDLVHEYAARIPHYALRHQVKPGISGWSQVRYGYAANLEETRNKLEYDLFYLRHFGPALDLRIAWRTFAALFDAERAR